jgi:hypothetical protein
MSMSDPQFLAVAAAAGALMGYLCGLIPRKAGRAVGREWLGNFALVACILAGGVCLGIVGALPLALFLASLIRGLGSPEETGQIAYARMTEEDFRRAGDVPADSRTVGLYTAVGSVIICGRCRRASSRTKAGMIPTECPHCGCPFTMAPTVRPTDKDRGARPADGEVVDLKHIPPPAPAARLAPRRSVS